MPDNPHQLPISIKAFASRLLRWYRRHKRQLPWRNNPDLYQIWLSEMMLQQTQVRTVLPYYERFLQKYPTLEDLARAEENEVLSTWSGLGYYNRARNLHRAAQIVCEKYNGEFPREYKQVVGLPGIGRYTAAAILSMAYDQALPVVDGNVKRVLARYLKIEEELDGPGTERLWSLLSKIVQDPYVSRNIGDFNQALMEVGALVCRPRHPDCLICPLTQSCAARKKGLQESLPRAGRRPAVQESHYLVAVIRHRGRYLLRQNRDGRFLKGFWEFPRIEAEPVTNGQETLFSNVVKAFRQLRGLELEIKRTFPPIVHYITFRKLNFYPLTASLRDRPPREIFVWSTLGEPKFPVASYIRKIERHCLQGQIAALVNWGETEGQLR